jgi:hypothetical protein
VSFSDFANVFAVTPLICSRATKNRAGVVNDSPRDIMRHLARIDQIYEEAFAMCSLPQVNVPQRAMDSISEMKMNLALTQRFFSIHLVENTPAKRPVRGMSRFHQKSPWKISTGESL